MEPVASSTSVLREDRTLARESRLQQSARKSLIRAGAGLGGHSERPRSLGPPFLPGPDPSSRLCREQCVCFCAQTPMAARPPPPSPPPGAAAPDGLPPHLWPSSLCPLPGGQRALKTQKIRSQLHPAPNLQWLSMTLDSNPEALLRPP